MFSLTIRVTRGDLHLWNVGLARDRGPCGNVISTFLSAMTGMLHLKEVHSTGDQLTAPADEILGIVPAWKENTYLQGSGERVRTERSGLFLLAAADSCTVRRNEAKSACRTIILYCVTCQFGSKMASDSGMCALTYAGNTCKYLHMLVQACDGTPHIQLKVCVTMHKCKCAYTCEHTHR